MPPKKKPGKLPSSLPAVPQYTPLVSQSEPHEAAGLPQEWCTSEVGVFKQLFTREIWESLCDNTNAYYLRQSMTESGPAAGTTVIPRSWKPTTVGELKVWVGLLLCMGVVRFPAITDYWRDYWKLNPMSAMSLNRFQQIKRYLHVSPPVPPGEKRQWWQKMEPMSSIAQKRFRECYVPSSNLSIDEMMVKCQGRSAHTLIMKNKPISQGYKLFALADHGYTYSWVYHSRTKAGSALESAAYESEAVTTTRPPVCNLQNMLASCTFLCPYKTHQFNIYFDNYFTNIALYATLREYKIGACETARISTIPEELRVDKGLASKELEWNDLFGTVVGDVLCGLWQDNAQVLVMSTIHDLQTGTLWQCWRYAL